jgi:benzoylformate decarboxylase
VSTGATAFVDALVAAGTRWVFGNPGTTEQAFLDALGGRTDIELVVALHEAVAVGAAEGWARVTGRPGVVQLHTRGGLGNAMGMLSNADTGRTPLVAYVGGAGRVGAHTEPALGGDLVAMAAPVSRWAWEVRSAAEIPTVVARAFKVATTPPFGPVVLAVPNDVMDESCDAPVVAPSWVDARVVPRPDVLAGIAERLSAAASPAVVIGDGIRTPAAGAAAARLAAALGAPIHAAYLTQAVLPTGDPLDAGELPLFDVRAAAARLAEHDLLLAVGADLVRSVFPRPGAPLPGQEVIHLGSDPWELGKNQPATAVLGDEEEVLLALAGLLDGRPAWAARRLAVVERLAAAAPTTPPPSGRLDADAALRALAAVLPDDAVLVDESVSAMPAVARLLPRRPGRWFRSRGGALGAGMSMAVGAAVADAGPVVALVGDGSAMYTVTSMWTAARRRLPVTWVVLDNGGYRILEANTRAWRGAGAPDRPFVGTTLGDPSIDVAAVAAGFGVASWRVERPEQLEDAMTGALGRQPSLVHVVLDGS